jgi:uncharacterized membrane protein (GlpM family)
MGRVYIWPLPAATAFAALQDVSEMALDPAFWLELALKMAMTATIVVGASILVERSGPFIGALIAALPTSAGAVYIILAIEYPPSFVAASAVGSMVSNAAVVLFALTYAALAQRHGLLVSLGGAFVVWFGCAALLHSIQWTAISALILNVIVVTAIAFAGRRFQTDGPAAKAETRRLDIAWRAATVAVCVAIVTVASHRIGSFASGMFAVFPVALGSFFHHPASPHRRSGCSQRRGPRAGAAVRPGAGIFRRAPPRRSDRCVVVLRRRAGDRHGLERAAVGAEAAAAQAAGGELAL